MRLPLISLRHAFYCLRLHTRQRGKERRLANLSQSATGPVQPALNPWITAWVLHKMSLSSASARPRREGWKLGCRGYATATLHRASRRREADECTSRIPKSLHLLCHSIQCATSTAFTTNCNFSKPRNLSLCRHLQLSLG